MNSKKYIDVAKETDGFQRSDPTDTESHDVWHNSDRLTLRNRMIGYLNNARKKAMEDWPDWPAWPGH